MAHAWKQHVCRQSGKEKKGGLKEKKIKSDAKLAGKQIWREVFPSDLTPLKPALAMGIKGSLSSEFCGLP